jgi:hypothetical protein
LEFTSLQPGDKVRVTQDLYDSVDVATIVVVSTNSLGKIMSFEEYCRYIQTVTHVKRYEALESHCSAVQKGMQRGEFLPIRIDEVAPLSEGIQDFWSKKGYTGHVHFIPESVALIGLESLVQYEA